MGRPSIVPELLEKLELYLEARAVAWAEQPDNHREPNLPSTVEGKINVRDLTLALGLKRSQEQHFFNHSELRTLVNAAAQAQGLAPIGSRAEGDEKDATVRNRIARVTGDRNDLAATLAEREAVIQMQRREIQSLRSQLQLRDETGMVMRVAGQC